LGLDIAEKEPSRYWFPPSEPMNGIVEVEDF
jgi:hypothetical protein